MSKWGLLKFVTVAFCCTVEALICTPSIYLWWGGGVVITLLRCLTSFMWNCWCVHTLTVWHIEYYYCCVLLYLLARCYKCTLTKDGKMSISRSMVRLFSCSLSYQHPAQIHIKGVFWCLFKFCSRKCATLWEVFLFSNFLRVLDILCFLLGSSPTSELHMPTFRNTLSVPSS